MWVAIRRCRLFPDFLFSQNEKVGVFALCYSRPMRTQQSIPITEIQRPKRALRPIRRDSAEYLELVESISKDGVLQPILVRPLESGGYEIVEGWHRYEASKEAGLDEIPCLIVELTDDEVLIFQLKCNSIRPKTQTFEYARRLKLLMERGLTMPELSRLIDKSPKWIKDQLHLNRLCEAAQAPYERGELKMTSALALANLPRDLQDKFLDDAISLPAPEFVERAKAALRDFKAYLLRLQKEDREFGVSVPTPRAINVLKREVLDSKNAKKVLKAVQAKTPLDGWQACLSWVFRLDPISVENRKSKFKEQKDEVKMNRDEYFRTNRKIIEKFVLPQSRTGDYKHE